MAIICSCTPADVGDTNNGNNNDTEKTDEVKITFYADENALEGNTAFTVKRGDDAEFKLTVADGYCIDGVSFSGECSVLGKVGEVLVAMRNIRYDEAVKVNLSRCSSGIYYYLNGGNFNGDVTASLEYYGDAGESRTHLRKNTSIGIDTIYRTGYTQTGWNTAADGSGRHIGLGSRVTVDRNTTLRLYAEWAKWSDGKLFEYENNGMTEDDNTDIIVTSYKGGNVDVLVIPEEIDGKKVTAIADGFADNNTIGTLIMHRYVSYVGDNKLCSIGSIYLSDSVTTFVNGGFNDNIKKCYVNASVAPRMIGQNSNGIFAESIDRLITNYDTDKSNLIFFGGCSLTYGLDCSLVEKVYGNKYYITEVGVNGDSYMPFQFDCVISYIKKGDVLIHAPEMASEQAMLIDSGAKEDCDWMLFSAIEGNYDLLSLVDFSSMHGVFTALANFNELRLKLPEVTYEAVNPEFNEYGDCITPRMINFFGEGQLTFVTDEEIAVYDKYVAMSAYNKLNEYYLRAFNKGATVYYTYAPCNVELVKLSGEFYSGSWNEYDALLRSVLDGNYVKIISRPFDYIFDSSYFYDTDYHLTSAGAKLRTEQLIDDMQGNGI